MSSSNKKQYWFVLDSVTQIQSRALTDEQLQHAVMRMQEKEWDRFFIWTESWEKWQPLKAFLKTNEKNFLSLIQLTKKVDAPEPTITKSVTYVRTDSESTATSFRIPKNMEKPNEALDFKKLNEKVKFKARSTRHDLKIEILLISKSGKSFRSYSRNISLTGSLLEDNIPFDFYAETFDVIVVSRKAKDPAFSRVQVKGQTIGDGVSRRIQFEAISAHAKNRLSILLNEYLDSQKNVVKKSG